MRIKQQIKRVGYKPKARQEVKDDGEGNWLVSYGDMMTLLFGFFVILSIFSTPDSEKLEQLREATAKTTGTKYVRPLKELTEDLKKIIKENNMDREIQISNLLDGIKLTASSTSFFDIGSEKLQDDAKKTLTALGHILKDKAEGFKIVVEGHTDDVPIKTIQFPSNWELSLRRSSEVVRLFEGIGIEHGNLRPVGLADIEPQLATTGLQGDALRDARSKNRRIVIRIIKQLAKR